uniref:Uncharacterized protein n=1 Tax=Schistosoma haematobium TaxID=6185 RepID=A0A094ZZV0_SCHHA
MNRIIPIDLNPLDLQWKLLNYYHNSLIKFSITHFLKCCAVEDNQADLYLRSVWYSRQIHQSSVFGTNSIRLLSQEYDNNLGIPSVVNVPVSCCVYSLETKDFSNRTACQIGSLKSNLNPYLNPHILFWHCAVETILFQALTYLEMKYQLTA